MKTKKINIPIFTGKLTLHFDPDLIETEKKYKTTSLENYGAVSINITNRVYVMSFGSVDIPLISHECVHITNFIFEDCGIKLDPMNDETQAYLNAWIFEQVYNFLK